MQSKLFGQTKHEAGAVGDSEPPKKVGSYLITDTTSGKVREWNLAGPGSIRSERWMVASGEWE